MNSFKKSLDIKMHQSVDKLIQARIKDELEKLESTADNPDYIKHIQDRKKKILEDIFPNFDYNMNIIDDQIRFKAKRVTSGEHTYKTVLDGIIKKKIYHEMDNLYTSLLNSKHHIDTKELNKVLSQISDREIRIGILLENFDKNMDILNNYKKRTSSLDQEPLMH